MTDGPKLVEGPAPARVRCGAEVLVESAFAAIAGKRVALITNQTGLANGQHLADLLHRAANVRLVAILGPEHGFRGTVEAGGLVGDGVDPATGVNVYSLYGKTKKPTPQMLRGADLLMFDIQDIGARFYTYISTMGLGMQAAAEAGIPFMVLDRPNPLGGDYVSGFTLEAPFKSFVGQYPIPIVHGLTAGELAGMIKAEGWLAGLERLDLRVVQMAGWKRRMKWPETGRAWVATSPNIPTFKSALVYPGIGIVGETQLVNEGRGMPEPFTRIGAPWLNGRRMASRLNALALPGVAFEAITYTPKSIPKVAANPLFVGRQIQGIRIHVRNAARVEPLEIGMHVLALVIQEARLRGIKKLIAKPRWFHIIAGNEVLYRMLIKGASGQAIIRAWRGDVAKFKAERARYLLYT